ncbi:NAD(P)-dependent oxidoreductase [Lichenibacterium dinghuense]|uniref:NAD(P)-dependent oxidoreductase n=1 Tax=Lichenibacterium dinghuense TaxID=2895977 RepID=UPI001EFF82CA|nr:NAD(P)-dependent oxidoreductase [Lichenibacterium sp. 6Y81]
MSEPRRRAPKPPGNIEPLATLPIFFKLGGRRALVAGGTPPAVWKAELIAAAGAEVHVVAAEPCHEMAELAEALPDRITLHRRGWTPGDFDGAAIAIGAFEGDEGEAFRAAAQAAGVPVNVIDVPPLCEFQFGTVVARSPLVIGISTDGAAPVFGQALRARIEALLPAGIGAWAAAAKDWREPLQALKLGFAARRRFWELFADMALEGGDRAPREEDRLRCMEEATAAEARAGGRVILVGAGPGPADQATLGAVRALQSADVILHEPGVAPGVLGLGRREARRLPAERDRGQAEAAVRALADEGRTVAWVGPGDPGTCANWAGRGASLEGSPSVLERVAGLRCPTCPDGCAAPAGGAAAAQ